MLGLKLNHVSKRGHWEQKTLHILHFQWCSRRPSHERYFDRMRNSMKICDALAHNILGWSQWNFAHVTTVTLSWHVQNFVVIGLAYFGPEHSKFLSNFIFDRNPNSGTGAWYPLRASWHKFWHAGIILGMGSANERRHYNVTPSLIGQAHTHNDPWHVTTGLVLWCEILWNFYPIRT